MANKKQNSEWFRSKRLMTEAFFELLKEKPKKRIQIKQLCERAGVARPTFYAHYDVIEDIPYEYYINTWLRSFSERVDQVLEKGLSFEEFSIQITECAIYYWGNQVDVYRSLKGAGMESVINQLFQEGSKLILEKTGRSRDLSIESHWFDLIIEIGAHSTFMSYELWVKTGMKRSAREIAILATILTAPDTMEKVKNYFGDKL